MFLILKLKNISYAIILVLLFLTNTPKIFASTTDGTVPANSFAWGENLSWINFGLTAGNIHVTNTAITGYAWSQNYGWINFSPTNGGVTNNTSGTLGGNAWATGLGGWIPFDGVTINSLGKFTGIAGITGSDAGRINFDCTNCSVTTDWRPSSGGGGGGGATTSTTTSTTTTSTTSIFTPTLAPTLAVGPFTPFVGQTFTAPSSPSQLFDVAAQPLLVSVSRISLILAGIVLFILLLLLIFLAYGYIQQVKRKKIEQIKKIKKIK